MEEASKIFEFGTTSDLIIDLAHLKMAHLKLKPRVASRGRGVPPDEGHLAGLDVDAEVGRGIRRRLYGSGPREPIVDGTVMVEEDLLDIIFTPF